MEEGHRVATTFTANLIREAVLTPNPAAERVDFQACLHVIDKIIREAPPLVPKTVRNLWHELREDKYRLQEDDDQDDDEVEKTEAYAYVFAEWVALVSNPAVRRTQKLAFINQLYTYGVLRDEDVATAFYRVNTQIVIGSYNRLVAEGKPAPEIYRVIDAFASLIANILEFNGDTDGGYQARIAYLAKILSLISVVFMDLHEEYIEHFQQKPFFRLFSMLLTTIVRDRDSVFAEMEYEMLATFGEALSVLQPNYFPDFTYSWWALVSHEYFMPKLLLLPNRKGWPVFTKQLISMLQFMEPRLRSGTVTPTLDTLLKGLLRTLLVVLHDFPDYLSTNHLTLCNLIPPGCLQLKNLVLSAFPPAKRLPDPFTEGLQLETLVENRDPPMLSIDIPAVLEGLKLQAPLNKYFADSNLSASIAEEFARRLIESMKITRVENGTRNGVQNGIKVAKPKKSQYNVEILTAVVMYIGMKGIDASQKNEETGVLIFDPKTPATSLLAALNAEFDLEGIIKTSIAEFQADISSSPPLRINFASRIVIPITSAVSFWSCFCKIRATPQPNKSRASCSSAPSATGLILYSPRKIFLTRSGVYS
jgi:CCR4-NOT transcription complex subunit 1